MNARLDRMEGEQEVAQLAATLGREFSYELMAAVATLDEADLHAELDKLVRAEILFQKGRPPGCTYIFKHALLEDALYNSLVKKRRQEFHGRAAAALETRFPQTVASRPELVAHHFTEAGLAENAIGYWLQAGLRSKERSADVEAIGHLTKGLALSRTLEETPERDRRELQFLATLGPAYIAVRGYAAPEVGPTLQRARELCERIGDPRQLFGIMLGMWEWRLVRGDLRIAVVLATDGMALAERLDDPGMWMEALFMPGATMFYRGHFAEARHHCEKAIAAYDDRERTNSGPPRPVTTRASPTATISRWHCGTWATRIRPSSWTARCGNSLAPSATPTASAMPSTSPPFSLTTAASAPRSRRPPRKSWPSEPIRAFSSGTRWARSTKGRECC